MVKVNLSSSHYNPVRYYLHLTEKTGSENLNDVATIYTSSRWQSLRVKPNLGSYRTLQPLQRATGTFGVVGNNKFPGFSTTFPVSWTLSSREVPLHLLALGIQVFIFKVPVLFTEGACQGRSASVKVLRQAEMASPCERFSQFLRSGLLGFLRCPATPRVSPHPSPCRSSLDRLILAGCRIGPSCRFPGGSFSRSWAAKRETHFFHFRFVGAPLWGPHLSSLGGRELSSSHALPYNDECLFSWPPPAILPAPHVPATGPSWLPA